MSSVSGTLGERQKMNSWQPIETAHCRHLLGAVVVMRSGFWMVRCCRECPMVAARIWLADTEPGEPDNHMPDRPFWQGQIALDLADPHEIWAMLEFAEATPAEQAALIAPPLSERAPGRNRAPAFVTAPMAKWKRDRAYRITEARWHREIAWLGWAERNKPHAPELHYRQPVAKQQMEIPRWT